jgi:biotin carboxylase
MAHVCFVDGAEFTLLAMRRAVDLGHEVTFVRPGAHRWYQKNTFSMSILERLHRIVDVDAADSVSEVTAALTGVQREAAIDAIVNTMDPSIETTALVAAQLGIRFTRAEGIANARDKGRARAIVSATGLASAACATAQTVDDAAAAVERIGCPVVLKPVSGFDSLLVRRADTVDDARVAARKILVGSRFVPEAVSAQFERGVLVEQYLEGELVSAEIGAVDGQYYRLLVTGRSVPDGDECLGMGAVVPGDLDAIREAQVYDYAERVCRALGLDFGVFHIEMMLTGDGPVLVEANPRMMGGVMTAAYQYATGHDFNDLLLDIHLGRRPCPKPTPAGAYALINKIMPVEESQLGDVIDLRWLESEDDAKLLNYKIVSGRGVGAMELLGRVLVRSADVRSGVARSQELLARLASSLGVPLVQLRT